MSFDHRLDSFTNKHIVPPPMANSNKTYLPSLTTTNMFVNMPNSPEK